MIGTASLNHRPFERHLIARATKKGARKKQLLVGLTLTSMVDMFSLLVIFLLQTFSDSPEILVMGKDVVLPAASKTTEIKDALILAISRQGVYVDKKHVGDLAQLLKNPEPMMEELEHHKLNWMKKHPTEAFKGEVTIQADKDLPSPVIARIMAMLPSQSYGSMQLAVISGGSSP